MFSKEKDMLKKYKQSFDDIDIPEQLDAHIELGFQKAKDETSENKRKFPFKSLLSVALIMIVLVGFASTKYIINLVKDDKGLVGAIEHDYYMEIGASEKINEVEFMIDGVIADEYGMVLFYTIRSDVKGSDLRISGYELESDDENFGQLIGFSPHETERKNKKVLHGIVEIAQTTPAYPKELVMTAGVVGSIPDGRVDHFYDETFTISFTLPNDILKEKVYELHEKVTIEGQNMTFTKAIVSPLRVKLHVEMDQNNTKKVLEFDDIHLIDETGETWGKFEGSIIQPIRNDNEEIIHLQSNYFTDPKELYVAFNKVQAINKEDEYIIVDPIKEEILRQPEGGPELLDVKKEQSYLVFTTNESFVNNDYPLSLGTVFNEDGEELDSFSRYFRSNEIGISLFDLDKETGPIYVKINSYPLWIKGNGKFQIK